MRGFQVGRVEVSSSVQGGLGKASSVAIRFNTMKRNVAIRQTRSKPVIGEFETWLTAHRARLSATSPLGEGRPSSSSAEGFQAPRQSRSRS